MATIIKCIMHREERRSVERQLEFLCKPKFDLSADFKNYCWNILQNRIRIITQPLPKPGGGCGPQTESGFISTCL